MFSKYFKLFNILKPILCATLLYDYQLLKNLNKENLKAFKVF